MKKFFCTLFLATLGFANAKADTVSIVFDKPTQIATSNANLIFTGIITNLTSSTVFLNGDFYTVSSAGITINDQFLNTVPISLAPGANSGDIELFDAKIPSTVPSGTSLGSYGLTGGSDGNAANNLGSSSFTIQPATPMPAPEIDPSLAGSGLILVAGVITILRGRRYTHAA